MTGGVSTWGAAGGDSQGLWLAPLSRFHLRGWPCARRLASRSHGTTPSVKRARPRGRGDAGMPAVLETPVPCPSESSSEQGHSQSPERGLSRGHPLLQPTPPRGAPLAPSPPPASPPGQLGALPAPPAIARLTLPGRPVTSLTDAALSLSCVTLTQGTGSQVPVTEPRPSVSVTVDTRAFSGLRVARPIATEHPHFQGSHA